MRPVFPLVSRMRGWRPLASRVERESYCAPLNGTLAVHDAKVPTFASDAEVNEPCSLFTDHASEAAEFGAVGNDCTRRLVLTSHVIEHMYLLWMILSLV